MQSKATQKVLHSLLLTAVLFAFGGCYSPTGETTGLPRFREESSANVVLHFYRWDNLFVTHPSYRENGFLRPLKTDDLGRVFDNLHVHRDLAVVVIGWDYESSDLTQIVDKWTNLLHAHGFRRVVCLHGGDNNKLDGLPIIEDWKQPVEPSNKSAQL